MVAFPDDIVPPPLQFNDDQSGANSTDDNHERPQEFANADPDVCPIRKCNNIQQSHDSDSHSNASVDVPFWEDEEKVLPFDQQEESSCQAVEEDYNSPSHGTSAERQQKQAVITPHVVLKNGVRMEKKVGLVDDSKMNVQ